MFEIASEQTYQNGQVIVQEGRTTDWVYVILSGAVELSKMVNGKPCVIALLHPGEAFGELGLLGGMTRASSAKAVGKTTVGLVDPVFLDREFDKLSLGAKTILTSVAETMTRMMDRACDFSSRREMRVLANRPVRYENKGSFIDAYAEDLSGGGLFLKSRKLLKVGEQFWIELHLPELRDPIRIKSEVVWAREESQKATNLDPGMGLKFIEITEDDYSRLQEYLKPLLEEPHLRC
jgi:type IV pilus assembly protein PilZ